MGYVMNITLYGASSDRMDDKYKKAVHALGEALAAKGHTLVYGAGMRGLMAAAAAGARSRGGRLIGVTTDFMHEIEPPYEGCDELIYAKSMSERKQIMESLGDAFVTVPGGIGTFDEFFQVLTLRLLGRHEKPLILFNPFGFWDGIIEQMYAMRDAGFITDKTFGLFNVCRTPDEVVVITDGSGGKQ